MMKNIIIVTDPFKQTAISSTIANILHETILEKVKDSQVRTFALSNIGTLLSTKTTSKLSVTGPYLDQKTQASYTDLGSCIFVDTSWLCTQNNLDTTTFGLGELIAELSTKGKKIFIDFGSSLISDCGCGALCALGVLFYDSFGSPFIPTGRTLRDIHRVNLDNLNKVPLTLIHHEENPFYDEVDQRSLDILMQGFEHLSFVFKTHDSVQ